LGIALDLVAQFEDDPVLRNTLNLDRPQEVPVWRTENMRAISEIALSEDENQRLAEFLRLKHTTKPGDGRFVAAYTNPVLWYYEPKPAIAATKPPLRDLSPAIAEKKRIPHPLVVNGQFDEILKQMDAGSYEAWEIFRLDATEFPKRRAAEFLTARAFGDDWRSRHRAMEGLWVTGPDGELAAALCYAVVRNLCIPHQVEMIDRIEKPQEFSVEVLKRIRHHANPKIRIAAILAMGRSAELTPGLPAMLLEASRDKDFNLRAAAVQAAAKHRTQHAKLQAVLETALIEESHPAVVAAAALGLQGLDFPAEFQRKVFESISLERLPETNLILIGCLLDRADPKSEAAAKLRALQDAMRSLYALEMFRNLGDELNAMIGEAHTVNRQAYQEQIEQLEKLKLLD
jgi:hypothetical protein